MTTTQATNLLFPVQVVVSVTTVLYLLSIARWRARSRGLPLPPGPRRLPIVGNMFNTPRSRQWIGYRDLSRELGDILHFQVLGQSVVVLGSADAILEYLDKRSANTSDRPQSPMLELTGTDSALGFLPYGPRWRRQRRTFWQHFHQDAVKEYRPTHRAVTSIFLEMLLENPSRLVQLIRFNFASTILKVVYDINVKDENDVYVEISEEAVVGVTEGLVPGKFLVEFLPFLRYIPPWFPGASSRRLWAKWRAAADRLQNVPFEHAKAKLESGEATPSVTAKLLTRMAQLGASSSEDEDVIKKVGAVAFAAGTDTKVLCSLLGMFLGVSLHPEVLRKAHAELDAAIGPHRLPDFADKDSLPYVNAIIKESIRWHSALPVGLPHANMADDEFRGYFIPAGTILIANTWACMHDPEAYEDPDVFRPERFIRDGRLDPSVRDPAAFIFGYGRRICPGRYFAEDAVFISVACALHVFNIGPPRGDDGRPIKIEHVQSNTLASYPEDCRCTITPRSAAAEALIRASAADERSQLKD
ncbi:cytochrome P450 [Ganoderma sinense ZZ0214-1]|uniref:Cytochrome P450 n=1 Tax=Ganoderma sinense ZZ0214-1 TaxID=1077348 RepID=A0A2G8S6S7_9APHY|nr:cytochrome P450 [Ganoderma sinense ZZ0214-1]